MHETGAVAKAASECHCLRPGTLPARGSGPMAAADERRIDGNAQGG